jgi:hypothetical protein
MAAEPTSTGDLNTLTEQHRRKELPADYVIARRTLTCAVVGVIAAAIVLAALHAAGGWTAGLAIWRSVKHWATFW